MSQKKAFITGITGQDGSYLAEFLLHKNYEIHGFVRKASRHNLKNINHILPKITLHQGDLSDIKSLSCAIRTILPDEVYHLGAQSHVGYSFSNPFYTMQVTGMATYTILEAMRKHCKSSKFYQASSSELFGPSSPKQNEQTPFNPCSPYAWAKLVAYYATQYFRNAYDMFCVNGILFNHESPRRGEDFVTRKITLALAEIEIGKKENLYLGNLDAQRDWGFSCDYVEAMVALMQQEHPLDIVVGTGECHSVKEFVQDACYLSGINSSIVSIDKSLFRDQEVPVLQADASLLFEKTGWVPRVSYKDIVRVMVACDRINCGIVRNTDTSIIHKMKDIFPWTELI